MFRNINLAQAARRMLVIPILAGLILASGAEVASAQNPGEWRGEYFNNMTLSGSPVLVRVDKSINFDWGTGSPDWGSVGADNFSVRWAGTINVSPGRYRFVMSSDDGARLWVNGQLVIDKWLDQQGGYHEVVVALPYGSAYVQMEYYENQGGAKASLAYMRESDTGGSGSWRGEYFNNKHLSGPAALIRNDSDINFNWGAGSPASAKIDVDKFSIRWMRNLDLMAGRYQFTVTVDDGVRLWVNNQLIIDQWRDQNSIAHRAEIDLPGGIVPVKMEYYENGGAARARLSWAYIYGGGFPGGVTPATGAWRAEYYNNSGLSGTAVLVRDEEQPNINWGYGSPAPGIVGNDFFSVRWTRTLDFIPGRYRFTATTDDGVRLWVNNRLIIDNWRNQAVQPAFGEIDLPGGMVPVRMEYFEGGVVAEAHLSWQRLGAAANTGGPAMTARVLTSNLNVRQGPGTTYTIISQLSRGQLVQLAGFRNADTTWVKLVLPDGRQGWSYAAYLQSSVPFSTLASDGGIPSIPVAVTGSTASVTNALYVNVRNGPGMANNVIAAVPAGTVVELMGRSALSSWVKIRLNGGTVGWMYGYFLNSHIPISNLPISN